MERWDSNKKEKVQLKPKETVTVKAVFVFLSGILLILVSFLFYLRFSGFSPMFDFYHPKVAVAAFNFKDYLSKETNESSGKTIFIKIDEAQLAETINLTNGFINLNNPVLKINTDGVTISGKTSGGIFGLNVDSVIFPKAQNGKLAFEVKEIKAAGVPAPTKIADPLMSALNMSLRNTVVPENLSITSVHCMVGYLLVEGTKK